MSAIIGMLGLVLTAVTWGEVWRTLDQIQIHNSEITAVAAAVSLSSPSLSTTPTTSSTKFRAHIAGAVRKPGVYELPNPSVVQDLVTMAGGLSGLVWQDYLDEYINLAAPVAPNQKIWIPSLTQRALLETPAVESQFATEPIGLSTVASDSSQLSINSASTAELDTLAGIGLKRAEAIVANRPYAEINELTSKAGVPASIVTQLKSQLKL